jgi:enamine deaminase RidA (YjgF/YER057c/UK114 family)
MPPALRPLSPPGAAPPFARYSHAVEVPAGARLVAVSGQLGVGPDGAVPEGAEAQARLCFAAIAAILAEAGMAMADVVRLNAYVTAREHMAGYMRARDAAVADPPPASTLMIVGGFTRPEFVVEVEALAARRD